MLNLKLCIPVLILLATTASAEEFGFETDKKLHFATSGLVGAVAAAWFDDRVYEYGACFGVGLAKEIYDEYDYGGWSNADLLYDAAGCALGVEVMRLGDWSMPDGFWMSLSPLPDGLDFDFGYRF